jgi:hypothetical protein
VVERRIDARPPIVTGPALMAAGALAPTVVPVRPPSGLPRRCSTPFPGSGAGTASADFNTGQVAGALAVAMLGALLASSAGFVSWLRLSFVIAALVAVLVTAAATRLTTTHRASQEHA